MCKKKRAALLGFHPTSSGSCSPPPSMEVASPPSMGFFSFSLLPHLHARPPHASSYLCNALPPARSFGPGCKVRVSLLQGLHLDRTLYISTNLSKVTVLESLQLKHLPLSCIPWCNLATWPPIPTSSSSTKRSPSESPPPYSCKPIVFCSRRLELSWELVYAMT